MNISEVPKSQLKDLRAPLATFDTVDLGEDRNSLQTFDTVDLCEHSNSLQTLHNDSFEQRSEVESTNSEASIPFEYSSFTEDFSDLFTQNLETDISKPEDVWSKITVKASPKHSKLNKKNSFEYKNLKEKRTLSASSSSDGLDSSDSECGYIKSGYVSVSSNSDKFSDSPFPCENFDSPLPQRAFIRQIGDNNSSCESTPFSSPNLTRNSLPGLLHELETVTEKSKRKAIEKRIQRLQVTNKPVERPRSTTPINVVNFEEYMPEKSPSINSEKLSIKLPPDEFRKRHKSPLRHHGDFFTFCTEDQLFTRTKSLVVETACKPGQSPKRVLIPPTLSPLCSPSVSPLKSIPVLSNNDLEVLFSASPDKWVAFPNTDSVRQDNSIKTMTPNHDSNSDDILTVSIVEGDKTCDISLQVTSGGDNKQINNSELNQRVNGNLHTNPLDDIDMNDSETSDLRREIMTIVNEIFDADSNLPQVFQNDNVEDGEMISRNSADDETNKNTAHLL